MGFKVHTSYRALIHKTIEICIDLSLIVDEFDTLQWRPELRSVSCTHGNCQISTTSNSRQIWITKGITFFWLTLYRPNIQLFKNSITKYHLSSLTVSSFLNLFVYSQCKKCCQQWPSQIYVCMWIILWDWSEEGSRLKSPGNLNWIIIIITHVVRPRSRGWIFGRIIIRGSFADGLDNIHTRKLV